MYRTHKRRVKLSRKHSKKSFRKHSGFHHRNGGQSVMRGGIRF